MQTQIQTIYPKENDINKVILERVENFTRSYLQQKKKKKKGRRRRRRERFYYVIDGKCVRNFLRET